MRAGRLRHKVTPQRYTVTQNDYGEEVESYSNLNTRRAAIEPLSGKEYFDAQQTTAEISIRVRLRADSLTKTLTARDRFLYGSRTLEIVSPPINLNERDKEIHLMCREIAP